MKKVWIIIAAAVVVIGGAIVYVLVSDTSMTSDFQQDTTNNQPQQQQNEQSNGDEQPQQNQPGQTEGEYLDYSAEAVANTEGRRWLFFHAPWCPQCRALEADIEKDGVPAGLTIFKVDYDTSTNLRQKYDVTLQTTVVEIDDNGNEIAKFVAYDDPTVEAVVNALGD